MATIESRLGQSTSVCKYNYVPCNETSFIKKKNGNIIKSRQYAVTVCIVYTSLLVFVTFSSSFFFCSCHKLYFI